MIFGIALQASALRDDLNSFTREVFDWVSQNREALEVPCEWKNDEIMHRVRSRLNFVKQYEDCVCLIESQAMPKMHYQVMLAFQIGISKKGFEHYKTLICSQTKIEHSTHSPLRLHQWTVTAGL